MVHFPGFARTRLCIHRAVVRVHRTGFPHSEIPGSKPACGSPRLIAACHVLHRLLLPRHPPCALSSLTIKFTQHTQIHICARRQILCASPLHSLRASHDAAPVESKALIKHTRFCTCIYPMLFSCQTSSLARDTAASLPEQAGTTSAQDSAPSNLCKPSPLTVVATDAQF
jgi:hypothetical protein